MAHEVKSIELPTGVTLQYVEQGKPDGTPVVLLPGGCDSWRSYERVLPHLPESLHVLALTPRGHGDSSKPADGYRLEDFAGDLAAFMDARRLDAAVVVAHSLSTWVVRRFAVDHPDRTLAIAMVGAPVGLAGNPVLQEMNGMFLAMPEPIEPGFVRELQSTVQPAPDEFIEAMVVECMKSPARVWRATAQAVREDDLSGELHRIAVPALIFVGGQDPLVPTSEAGTMAKVIPDARLLVYEHAGHAVHWEEPERFAADLVAFVESVVR